MSEQAKTDECLLHNIAATVDADTTTSDVAEPRVSPCCQPAEFAETVTIAGSSLCNHWLYATIMQVLAICRRGSRDRRK